MIFFFFNFLLAKTTFLFRISFYDKNKTCHKFYKLPITYFLEFFIHIWYVNLRIYLTVCSLKIKGFIKSHVQTCWCILWKLCVFEKKNVLQQSRQSLLRYRYIYETNWWISQLLEFFELIQYEKTAYFEYVSACVKFLNILVIN